MQIVFCAISQVSHPNLVGYFHNWQDANASYLQLDQTDLRYKIVDIAFAVPQQGTNYKMEFTPDQVSQATFLSQIHTLQSNNRKVLISIGGANAPVILNSIAEADTFVSTMTNILQQFDFDGVDIDLEGSSISVSGGTIGNPVDTPIIHLIESIRQIMDNFYLLNGHKMILTMAPEAAYVQGGMSAYGGIWGAYLPIIDALRDSIDLLHVQLYNTGTLYGIDQNIYSQGTADFIIAMTEAVIQGFSTTGGTFNGLPEYKVAVGLPACPMAAGGGFTHPDTVRAAMHYLLGNGPKPGNYTLLTTGYPNLGGMMTWSINWDATANCNSSYEYASNYDTIFNISTQVLSAPHESISIFPNPAHSFIRIIIRKTQSSQTITLKNSFGESVLSQKINSENEFIDVSNLVPGVYFLFTSDSIRKIIIE